MILGGIVAGIGIENPKRRVKAVAARGTAQAGECGHSADCDCVPAEPGETAPELERA